MIKLRWYLKADFQKQNTLKMCRFNVILPLLFSYILFVTLISSESFLNNNDFAESVNNFSCNFLKQLNYGNENIVFSPLSIYMAIGMVLKGAKGATADQIYGFLNLNEYSDKQKIHNYFTNFMSEQKQNQHAKPPSFRNITIELANLILINKNFVVQEEFKTAMRDEYFAAVANEDFVEDGQKIMDKVNKFVKERTHELIPKVLNEPLPTDTVMFILNSIYFKAFWTHMFHKSSTIKSRFYNSNKSNSSVQFMTEDFHEYHHFIDSKQNLTLLEMDYIGNSSMIFILPHERYGLTRIINTISSNVINDMLKQGHKSVIPVKLPKFKFDFNADLKKVLVNMGLNSIFNHPDLSGIAPNIKVSDAKHKAMISVDEGGTEAAAITTLQITPESLYIGPEFIADHPFLFIIREKTNGVNLFVGILNNLNQ